MKVLFLNGSRGEWGYIRPIIDLCRKQNIDYSICATNMLLLPAYGSLVDELRRDGYNVSDEIHMSLEGHNHFTMAKSLGIFLTSFIDVLMRNRPDWIVLAGDRGEQLMGAVAATYTYTPVAHIQAGERSGNIDGVARHAIGKFVHLHFAANDDAAERLRKLGEEDFRIHMVGAPQLDELVRDNVATPAELEDRYGISVSEPFILAVQHPVTEEMEEASSQVEKLCAAISSFPVRKVWVLPNNDAGSHAVRQVLLQNRNRDTLVFENITRRHYLGLLKNCQVIVGNSSSGLLEAPTFKTPAVNIGRRQADRVQGINVINADFEVESIKSAIEKAISPVFVNLMLNCINPYGDGHSAKRIIEILQRIKVDDKLLIKRLTY